jgi:hypothetical protein
MRVSVCLSLHCSACGVEAAESAQLESNARGHEVAWIRLTRTFWPGPRIEGPSVGFGAAPQSRCPRFRV